MILFNKEIEPRKHYCQLFDNDIIEVDNPYINIQVKLPGCNASCEFCESKEPGSFNEDEYLRKLKLISNEVPVNKLNFTGGEPTLNFERLERLVHKTKEILPDTRLVINTNGHNFEKLFENLYNYVDNIQLSRHHYLDIVNDEILGFKSVSSETIKNIASTLTDKRFLNLSCNLIEGYIDNREEVFIYLEKASNMDVKWVGFVDLVPLNRYCEDKEIRFEDLDLQSERLVLTKHWKDGNKCQCFGYVYIPIDLSDPVRVYNKRTEKADLKQILVFDGENFNIGFSDNVLI